MVSLFYPPAFCVMLPKNSLHICELFSDSVEEKENIEKKEVNGFETVRRKRKNDFLNKTLFLKAVKFCSFKGTVA